MTVCGETLSVSLNDLPSSIVSDLASVPLTVVFSVTLCLWTAPSMTSDSAVQSRPYRTSTRLADGAGTHRRIGPRSRVVPPGAAHQRRAGAHARLRLLLCLAHAAGAHDDGHARPRVGRHDAARRARSRHDVRPRASRGIRVHR